MKGERTDRLRRRPDNVRYFYLAVSPSDIHTGTSHGGLQYVVKHHGVTDLYLSDLVTGKVTKIGESISDFMSRWRQDYNNAEWDYESDVLKGVPVPVFKI